MLVMVVFFIAFRWIHLSTPLIRLFLLVLILLLMPILNFLPVWFALSLLRLRLFFFSSRRRHTRWTGDWSSDVCSSDLKKQETAKIVAIGAGTMTKEGNTLPMPVKIGDTIRSEERRVGKECCCRFGSFRVKIGSDYPPDCL